MKRLSLFLLFFCLANILKADNKNLIQHALNSGYPPHYEGTFSFGQSDRSEDTLQSQKFKAHPFPLQDVHLLDGPFKSAMDRHIQVLLEMDPDRLLFNFRVNAGLSVTAEPLGNWESPSSELRGHLTGHYLSACALMVAATGDHRFKERAAYVVSELSVCQRALGTSGYLSAFPESFFDRLETSGRVWAPFYTLHKILAGLLDVHSLCNNNQALEVAVAMGNWVTARTDKLSDDELQKMLAVEHGGINEAMAKLYSLTDEETFLRTAKRLYHKRVLDPLATGEDKLAGLHANTQFPKVIGLASLYDLTGEASYKSTSEFFWDRVVNHHSYVIGGNSDHEGFGPPDALYDRVSPYTAETCNTYNMLKLTRQLFAWDALATQADFYERALYNHILPSQNPHSGRVAYHVPVYGGWFMPYDIANESAWCCTGTGLENHAKYGDSIYWYDAEGIFINLFIPSELNWRDKSIILCQETCYPEEDAIRIKLQCSQPAEMNLRVRYPGWAQRGMDIKINGGSFPHNAQPGSYVEIKRTWKSDDFVDVKIPMDLRLEPMPDNSTRAAICYGPVVLAGELGSEGIVPPMPHAVDQGEFFTVQPPPIPIILAGGNAVNEWVEPVPDKPLTFRTKGVGQPQDITLIAFYQLPPQRYSIYWDILTHEQLTERQTQKEQNARQAREMTASTLDSVAIGDAESERAHNLNGGNTSSGTFLNRSYRHVEDGGWFSYDLEIPPGQPFKLLCTFWGSDAGPRLFDILINETRIATKRLDYDRPGEFFNVVYPLSAEMLQDRKTVTIKFQAQPGQMAGGIFDLRVLKPDFQ